MASVSEMIKELYEYCREKSCGDYPCLGCIFNDKLSCDFEVMHPIKIKILYNQLKEARNDL